MKKSKLYYIFSFIFCFSLQSFAQFQDDFSDGDFTTNPEWFGDIDNFIVDNDMLRLDAPGAGESHLVTESQAIEDAVWEFYVQMDFQPSGSNLARVYLVSNLPNVMGSVDGYFVEIGGSSREISLFKQEGNSTTKIIAGVENSVLMNPVNTTIRVTRDETGNWELLRDTLGGNDYISEGTVFDDTFVQGFYFGVHCDYTATRADRFHFDNFNVTGDAFFDPDPPVLEEVNTLSQTEVELIFDKPLQEGPANDENNFTIDNGVGSPLSATRDANDFSRIELTFDPPLQLGVFYTVTAENMTDLSGNVAGPLDGTILYVEPQTPSYGDIIINEFIPNESPSVGLPERQFVEIINRSNKFFNLNGWKLSDRTGTGTIQDAWIYPDSILILVPTGGLEDFSTTRINVTNWQSLNNTGDDIILETNDSILVDQISYTDEWYQDEDKSDGGWSIERINPELVCSGADNWKASNDPSGGTPGKQNSVYSLIPDETPPSIIDIRTVSDNELFIEFSEGLNGAMLETIPFEVSPNLTVDSIFYEVIYPTEVIYIFEEDFVPGEVYSYELNGIEDCNGNATDLSGTFVLPQIPDGDEVVINEILFRSYTGGSDFVELYNRSDKFIDLKGWELANYDDDTVANHREINIHYILEPDDYVVITRDSAFQLDNYPYAVSGKFIELASLPSYRVDSSTVFLVANDSVVDKVSYSRDWHFKLLNDDRGVSLERFDAFGPSNDENNWHSAAEPVGFATPGRENSQINNVSAEGTLTLSSNSFSPDNDGFEDVLLITYELTDPQMLGKLVIYDDVGRKTKELFSNHLLGNKGTVKWDGVREDGNKASIGPYIILFEAFNADSGETIKIRKVVTLAGQL